MDTSSTTNGPSRGQTLKILWYLLNEIHIVIHWPDCYGEKQFDEAPLELGWGESTDLGMFVHRKQGLFLSVYVDDIKIAGKKQNMAPMWKKLNLKNQRHFLNMYIWDVVNVNANQMKQSLNDIQRCLNHVFLLEQLKKLPRWEKPQKQKRGSYDVEGHARKCVERYCELANKKVEQFYKASSPCFDDHQFKQEELESVGELSEVCSQIVSKRLYLARIGRPDILWSVNKLARSVTKRTQACDMRLARLISYIVM